MTRRVYDLDDATLGVIQRFAKRNGLTSEVAAVRKLIAIAAISGETVGDLVERYNASRDAGIFYGHPLVESIHQVDGEISRATMRSGAEFGFDGLRLAACDCTGAR